MVVSLVAGNVFVELNKLSVLSSGKRKKIFVTRRRSRRRRRREVITRVRSLSREGGGGRMEIAALFG